MLDQNTARDRFVAAALKLAVERPWRDITLLNIAQEAGLTLADLRREFATKSEILIAFARAIDEQVLRTAGNGGVLASRDAIFDVVMSRFDALAPYKPALRAIARSTVFEPALLMNLLASQHWMLQAAGFGTDGLIGSLRISGLASVYSSVFRIWLDDDDPGLARTMAALDRRLRRGERVLAPIEDISFLVGRIAGAITGRAKPTAATGGDPGAPPAGGLP
ncbi:MAG TPA: TetR/AcrR family transcriptional regulator [Hyphomicrobiaceae bacterium]|jgi:AcrR family transcriptional regulator|nr:TetR/AcrR family transcriptional regulator [Hyphomicrobiaceae bacterium]